MSDNAVSSADHLDVISYATHAQELTQRLLDRLVAHHFIVAR